MARLAQTEQAVELHITGIVQGVGFRPHVYKLATSMGLKGWVINTTAGVTVRLEGAREHIERFVNELHGSPPPLALIESFTVKGVKLEGYSDFFIHESRSVPDTEVSIPPDVGTCPDCLREYRSASDRRYGYPFANCTNCGPRFSITRAAPYDRANTSMSVFSLCEKCAAEYADPADRRFHAEPNACPVCGPKLTITLPDGAPIEDAPAHNDPAPAGATRVPEIRTATTIRSLLKQGRLLAIKGVGGYHLACDAHNDAAVRQMRERKRREMKPFALMCRDLETIRTHCELSCEEERLLTSPARPILLLTRKPSSGLSDGITPGLDTLGVMLPYTPLHYGLFDDELDVLVMTSANISGDPLVTTEDEAYAELGSLADYFVVHPRAIVNRSDDSVLMFFNGGPYFIRRARGYVPRGVKLPFPVAPILSVGGDLKSVFAYARDEKATLSQYFGDLDNLKNFHAYEDGVRFFGEFLHITPEAVVCDLHPGYISTQYAERYAEERGIPLVKVQHHKAHFASVMADNGLNEKVVGISADGTGYGEDGTIWGCEVFYGDCGGIERVGSLMPFRQPRGDAIAKNPLHMAAMLLYGAWGDEEKVRAALPGSDAVLPFVRAQVESKTLSIASSSCGRLFDAAAALCGFTGRLTYEGEAAMRMEALARSAGPVEPYRFELVEGDLPRLSWQFLAEMAEDALSGTSPGVRAARFHYTMVAALCALVETAATRYNADRAVFSGGTFQNRLVIEGLTRRLRASGIEPYFHRQVPANDGGLALGQVVLAGKRA